MVDSVGPADLAAKNQVVRISHVGDCPRCGKRITSEGPGPSEYLCPAHVPAPTQQNLPSVPQ